jgi:hypothetical protein
LPPAPAPEDGVAHAALDPKDELSVLLHARSCKAAELAAMKEKVHAEMTAAMDTGVRVNSMIAQIYGVPRPASISTLTLTLTLTLTSTSTSTLTLTLTP